MALFFKIMWKFLKALLVEVPKYDDIELVDNPPYVHKPFWAPFVVVGEGGPAQ